MHNDKVFQKDGHSLKYLYLCKHKLPMNETATVHTAGEGNTEHLLEV